jgi:hypothetical protein
MIEVEDVKLHATKGLFAVKVNESKYIDNKSQNVKNLQDGRK